MGVPRLRTVGFTCPETGRAYVFLTNIFHLTADVVADIYKQRWQIELFFKWLKQNLTVRGCLGTSRNAVLTQIWIALLLASLKFLVRIGLSQQAILRLLQLNLFRFSNHCAATAGVCLRALDSRAGCDLPSDGHGGARNRKSGT